MPHVLVWGIDTVPDLAALLRRMVTTARAKAEILVELGDKFPSTSIHSSLSVCEQERITPSLIHSCIDD